MPLRKHLDSNTAVCTVFIVPQPGLPETYQIGQLKALKLGPRPKYGIGREGADCPP